MTCKCKDCHKNFKTEKAFQSHACVTNLEKHSLEELLALYAARQTTSH